MTPRSSVRYPRRVQFAETDLAGVVHFSCYFRYIEEAEHALWRDAGLSIAPKDLAVGFPRIAASIEYHAPLHFEDVCEVWVRIRAISNRTISYDSTVTCGGTVVATATHTAVCVDKHARPLRAIDIPAEIRQRLAVEPGLAR
jgi:acyl-CoA thioester hydrolase